MKLALIVGIGSFLGGSSRYLLSTFLQQKTTSHFPYGTFAVNLIGCFVIGCLAGFLARWQVSNEWRLFLVTGILGGFTTFSAFAGESNLLFRTGHHPMALLYIISSVVLGIGLAYAGAWIFRFEPGL